MTRESEPPSAPLRGILRSQHPGIGDEIDLREPYLLREVGLHRVSDADLPPVDRQDLRCVFLAHVAEVTQCSWAISKKTSSRCFESLLS